MFRDRSSFDGLSALLPFILPNQKGLLMVLAGFFDESERSEKSEPMSVAGYIFKPKGYHHFVRKWERMLKSGPTPTTHFHMTHLYARTYEYEGWSVEQRADVLRQAIDAVRKHAFCGISVLFSQSEFERLRPPLWEFKFGSIYTAACQMVLRMTAYAMDRHLSYEPIAYAFESGHRFWDEANAILTGTGKDPQLKRVYRYHSHTAIDKEQAYGLQAADMLAWIMTRLTVGAPSNHTMRTFVPLLNWMVRDQSQRTKYYLFHSTGEHLRQFFNEQMSRQDHIVVSLEKAKRGRLR
jgi:hypothetical protein